jgi:hypothetical protein
MKSWLEDVNLVIWETREFKCNVVPLYMAEMVYAKVGLSVDMGPPMLLGATCAPP